MIAIIIVKDELPYHQNETGQTNNLLMLLWQEFWTRTSPGISRLRTMTPVLGLFLSDVATRSPGSLHSGEHTMQQRPQLVKNGARKVSDE